MTKPLPERDQTERDRRRKRINRARRDKRISDYTRWVENGNTSQFDGGYDPVDERPSNNRKARIKSCYDQLLENGHEDEAERLREMQATGPQNALAKNLTEDYDLDWV